MCCLFKHERASSLFAVLRFWKMRELFSEEDDRVEKDPFLLLMKSNTKAVSALQEACNQRLSKTNLVCQSSGLPTHSTRRSTRHFRQTSISNLALQVSQSWRSRPIWSRALSVSYVQHVRPTRGKWAKRISSASCNPPKRRSSHATWWSTLRSTLKRISSTYSSQNTWQQSLLSSTKTRGTGWTLRGTPISWPCRIREDWTSWRLKWKRRQLVVQNSARSSTDYSKTCRRWKSSSSH